MDGAGKIWIEKEAGGFACEKRPGTLIFFEIGYNHVV